MANQKSVALRNAELDQTEVIAGTSARFMLLQARNQPTVLLLILAPSWWI